MYSTYPEKSMRDDGSYFTVFNTLRCHCHSASGLGIAEKLRITQREDPLVCDVRDFLWGDTYIAAVL